MQPYIFPYLGYFQLINVSNVFVFYDDVNFIKRGWINRNQILVNKQAYLFTIPLVKASQNKLINEVTIGYDEKWLNQFFGTIEQNYKKALYFSETFELIKNVFNGNHNTIADLTIDSIVKTSNHLDLPTVFEKSSEVYAATKGLNKADRLIEISKQRNCKQYINPQGGMELYDKTYFSENGIRLFFIENKIPSYQQFSTEFVGGLSIIDVLMFNSTEQVRNMLTKYNLV